MDNWEKFTENHLPLTEAFYSRLNLSRISEHNYNHAQSIWREFGMKNLRVYQNLCLKTNVLLLCNVFKIFRSTCLENYSLDPAYFYTSQGLAWQACFKKTKVSLELTTDPNMLLKFEQGMQGGITQAIL